MGHRLSMVMIAAAGLGVAIGVLTPNRETEGVALATEGSCGWDCCRPMALKVHATGYAMPDLINEPNGENQPDDIDLVWEPITGPVTPPRVPVRVRVRYCQGAASPTACIDYEGVIPADPMMAGPGGIVPIGAWPPKYRISSCGQDDLPYDLEQLVHVESWENMPGPPPCGNIEAYPDPMRESCFADTDYRLVIARTVADSSPSLEDWCFVSIDLWVHDPTDTYSPGADDSAVLVQHDYDVSAPQGTQCPAADQYLMIGAPAVRVTRGDFEFVVPNVRRPCLEAIPADSFYGGHHVERCFFGVFDRF